MYCPYCGRTISNRTTICPYCKGFVSEAMIAAYYDDQSPDRDFSYGYADPNQPVFEEPKRRKWPFVVALLLVLALVAIFAIPLAQEAMSANRSDHRVTFLLRTPGYTNEATALPVHVKGTQLDGGEYDEIVYLDGGGNGVSLEPGEYVLTFPGGSILPNGNVLVAPSGAKIEVTVPEGLARNEFVQVPTDQAVTYTVILPADLTDKTLKKVFKYAVKAPGDNGKADKLRDNAKKVRKEAKAKREATTAAIEKEASGNLKVSIGDEAKFIGTLEVNTPEEVAQRLGDESIAWNLEGQTLGILWLEKPRKVTIETSYSDEYDGYDGYYDTEDGQTYTTTEEYEVKCLVLNSDMEGIYSVGDDGTLSAHSGKKVLAEGTIEMPTDWASSLISPIMLANPTLEDL